MNTRGAEDTRMKCIRCGADAAVKRDDAYYCGACAINRDWQDLIAVIQDARVESPVAGLPDSKSA
jgi:hypothetical protein